MWCERQTDPPPTETISFREPPFLSPLSDFQDNWAVEGGLDAGSLAQAFRSVVVIGGTMWLSDRKYELGNFH